MKKIFGALAVMILLVGCGSPDNVGQKDVGSIPSQKPDYLKEGIAHLNNANPNAAISSFDQAIKQNPRDARTYLILGETYMRLNQYARALDTFTAATRVAPTDGHLYYLMAVSSGLNGNAEQAKINAEKSIVLFQRNKDVEGLKKSLALLKGLTGTVTK